MANETFDTIKRQIPIERVARDLGIQFPESGKAARCFNTSKGHHRNAARDEHPNLIFFTGKKGYPQYCCRVCGKDTSGTVIDLVMAIRGGTAGEAADWLRQNYSSFLPQETVSRPSLPPSSPPSKPEGAVETSSRRTGGDGADRPAPGDPPKAVSEGKPATAVYARLIDLCPPGPALYDYLEKVRGIPRTVLATVPIGWIGSEQKVMETLRREFSEKELLGSGVLIQRKDKNARPFPVLWNMKLIYPFCWGKEIVWIQCRSGLGMDESGSGPKFLNVSAPLPYPFNANAAVHSEELYMTEGILDLAQLVALGVKNAVALPGVDMFKDSFVPWLRACGVRRVHICFDADRPGTDHTLDIAQKLLSAGILTTAAILPKDEDLNSFWRGRIDSKAGEGSPDSPENARREAA